jgi:hypothetical protein
MGVHWQSSLVATGAPFHSSLVQELLEQQLQELRECREGEVADYIPELAKADPDDFGIVLATADGRVYAVGDADKAFTIQSISKPFMYGLALRLLSPTFMEGKVGVEPGLIQSFHLATATGCRSAIASSELMSCFIAWMPAWIERKPSNRSRLSPAVRKEAITPAPLPR